LRASRQQNIAGALSDIEAAIAVAEEPAFLSLRAAIHQAQGDGAKAITDLKRVRGIAGELSAQDQMVFAEACLQTSDWDGAISYAESARAKGEDLSDAHKQRLDAIVAEAREQGASK
jgi:hypothetical protein